MLLRSRSTQPHGYAFELRPQFPTPDALIRKAKDITTSCRFQEQLQVGHHFLQKVIWRGVRQKRYLPEDAERMLVLINHMVEERFDTLPAFHMPS